MKLNIFSIPMDKFRALKAKLEATGMRCIYNENYGSWNSEFYFSESPEPTPIPWAPDLEDELAEIEPMPMNTTYFGAYLWQSGERCFAISFGKTFLYLRDYCDHDFGLSMACRIVNRKDIRQKSTRRYAGRKKREIRSYQRNSELDVESGESVELLQGATIDAAKWGKVAKFGSSMLITLPISASGIPQLLSDMVEELANPPKFELPITLVIADEIEQRRFDETLVSSILGEEVTFETNAHQLIGVDFIFPGSETYLLKHLRCRSEPLDHVTVEELRKFVMEQSIPRRNVLQIKVQVKRDDSKGYTQPLKETLDFSIEPEKVFLQNGHWVRFNEDYLNWLNSAVDRIPIDPTLEGELRKLDSSVTEPSFNKHLSDHWGYEYTDKDFSILKFAGHPVEACDLIKDGTLYAVKFGKAQDLSYVCSQASGAVDILLNEPARGADLDFKTYCIWLVLKRSTEIQHLSDIKSMILKQRLDDWARRCRNAGILPALRISYKGPGGTVLPVD